MPEAHPHFQRGGFKGVGRKLANGENKERGERGKKKFARGVNFVNRRI